MSPPPPELAPAGELSEALPGAAEARAPRALSVTAVAEKTRIHFVDLVRLLASLQMVHGHTLDALLAEELRQGVVFERWSWGRGLVSVGFMFAAGLSYHLSTLGSLEAYRADPARRKRRVRRALSLVAIGYLLHLPVEALAGDPARARLALEAFQMVDVLHCIGLSLLALEGLTALLRDARRVVLASALIATVALLGAPLTEALDPAGPLRPVLNYFTHRGGSLFPLFPWAAFVFGGVVVGALVLPEGTRTSPAVPPRRLLWVTLGVLTLYALAELSPVTLFDPALSRNASPAFNLLKLSVVLGIVTALAAIGQHVRRLPRFLRTLAAETLALYVVHLLVIYGAFVGLTARIGHTLPLPQALLTATLMVPLMAGLALGWHRLKARHD